MSPNSDQTQLEEGLDLSLDFEKLKRLGLSNLAVIPVIVQEANSKAVLMLGYANDTALQHTLTKKVATFWSTSRQVLWEKGSQSGQFLDIVDVRVNCEQNALLYMVRLRDEGACHTKNATNAFRLSCFYRRIDPQSRQLLFL